MYLNEMCLLLHRTADRIYMYICCRYIDMACAYSDSHTHTERNGSYLIQPGKSSLKNTGS